MPKISIIVPVYNREKLLSETLESIRNQTYTDWECVLVDDGSTDNSLQLLHNLAAKDSRLKVYSRPEAYKKGAPSCRNYGYELAKGEYIQFFDSDDLMLQDMLERKITVLEENNNSSFVVAKMGEFNSQGTLPTPQYNLKTPTNNLWNFMRYRVFFLTPGPLFRKDFLDKFNLKFDTSLERRQEREFFTRIMLTSPDYLVIDEVLSLRRIHDTSIKKLHEELSKLQKSKSSYNFYLKLSRNAGSKYAGLLFNAYKELIFHLIVTFVKEKSIKFAFKTTILYCSLYLKKILLEQVNYSSGGQSIRKK